jgi:hypothetical protein
MKLAFFMLCSHQFHAQFHAVYPYLDSSPGANDLVVIGTNCAH